MTSHGFNDWLAQRRVLTAAMLSALSMAPSGAFAATTWTVNTCTDAFTGSGTTGSLRYVVANADSGDLVDMTALTCSAISLQTGSVQVNQANLELLGPGAQNLSISALYDSQADRVFNHTGTGSLRIRGMTLSGGTAPQSSVTHESAGGCIYSNGSVYLGSAVLTGCSAQIGGGVFTSKGTVELNYSQLTGNVATGLPSQSGGGAVYAADLVVQFSTLSGNSADRGGAILATHLIQMFASTISGNHAGDAGGAAIYEMSIGEPSNLPGHYPRLLQIADSTISGNDGVAIKASTAYLAITNSTIAFNTSSQAADSAVTVVSSAKPIQVTLQSSIFSNNTTRGVEEDLAFQASIDQPITFSSGSSNNLIVATAVSAPADTLRSCALLGGLRDNGGPTWTHALLSGSPALDHGSNAFAQYDQRGTPNEGALYPRVDHGVADIGAYEVHVEDIIFNTAFEGCPSD